ncbi:hypothetical protein ACT7DC_05100 [Bacillus cereus]
MITLTGHTLTVEEMKRLLLEGEGVTACPTSMQKVAECREVVEKIGRGRKSRLRNYNWIWKV